MPKTTPEEEAMEAAAERLIASATAMGIAVHLEDAGDGTWFVWWKPVETSGACSILGKSISKQQAIWDAQENLNKIRDLLRR